MLRPMGVGLCLVLGVLFVPAPASAGPDALDPNARGRQAWRETPDRAAAATADFARKPAKGKPKSKPAPGKSAPAKSAPAKASPPAAPADQLAALLARQPKATRIGLIALDAETGDVLFNHNGDQPLKPASLQKLFVTAAALDRFGPAFAYETRVYLRGDELLVEGAGDPGLGDERLAERLGRTRDVFDEWAAALAARGVTRIARIVLDDTIFEPLSRHPDWPVAQADRWYQAPVGGLNVNDNCLDPVLAVRGAAIDLRLTPDLPAQLVENRVTPGKSREVVAKRPGNRDVFEFSGTLAGRTELDSIAAGDPLVFFGAALTQALVRHGIHVAGEPQRQRLSAGELAGAEVVATHRTPLPDVLWRANTFSQNLFAECLLKSLPAYDAAGGRTGTHGSWDAGRSALTAALHRFGVETADLQIRDGSGLSHGNRATARQFAQVLQAMRRHRHAELFADTLAVPGRPGSMKGRYTELRDVLRGKTGTLQGVHCLAGYLTRSDGRVISFALLINGNCQNTFPVQACRLLLAL